MIAQSRAKVKRILFTTGNQNSGGGPTLCFSDSISIEGSLWNCLKIQEKAELLGTQNDEPAANKPAEEPGS